MSQINDVVVLEEVHNYDFAQNFLGVDNLLLNAFEVSRGKRYLFDRDFGIGFGVNELSDNPVGALA